MKTALYKPSVSRNSIKFFTQFYLHSLSLPIPTFKPLVLLTVLSDTLISLIMRYSAVALLGLASAAVAEVSTWQDVLGDVPQCVKTCLDDFYTNIGFEDECGSPDEATVDCLCGVKDTFSKAQSESSKLQSCFTDGCDAKDLTTAASKLTDYNERFRDLQSQCKSSDSSSDSSDSSSGGKSLSLPWISSRELQAN